MKTISIKDKNWKRIKRIQLDLEFKTLDETIEFLIFEYLKYQNGEY